MSASLRPHGLHHTRLPCPSLSPGVCSNSCPFSRWCHPTISSSAAPFSCSHSFLASWCFLVSQLFLSIRWPKYWSFSFRISPSNEYSGLISFRVDWLDILAVEGTLQSLLQHHSSKASILWHSAFFIVQLTSVHDYRKDHSLTGWTFVGKVMSLSFNVLSRLVIAFLSSCKCLNFFICWRFQITVT